MKRTDNQLKAILHDNGNVVVTASAGSGKTSVMIERFLRLILERKARVKEVLAVTFTKLAAAEMKEKLAAALKKKIAEGCDKEYLKSELDDLFVADISTVHSFCGTIIKRYFYVVGVDPTFSVADESVTDDIKKEAISEVFDELYEAEDERLYRLLDVFSRGRKDKALKDTILDVFEFASQEADPDRYLELSLSAYTEKWLESAENEVIEALLAEFAPVADKLREDISFCRENNENKYLHCLEQISSAYAAATKDKSEQYVSALFDGDYKKETKSKKESEYSRALSDRLKAAISQLKALGKEYRKALPGTREERKEKTISAGKTLEDLIALVKLFEKEYSALKAEKNVLDFSDLEHFTCKILKNDRAREEIAANYKYVFVDEYQDTNGAQEEIFALLERENLFIVGDVKQSIYAFRGSKPDILIERAKRAGKDGFVNLDSNFRSTENVVNAVNAVFSRVMKKSLGGVDYSREPMIYGGLYKNEKGLARVETYEKIGKTATDISGVYGVIKHLNKKKEEKETQRAALVAKIIDETVGSEYYDENGKKRRFTFGDVMIVSRKNSYEDVTAFLVKRGFPVSSEAETELKDYYEINMLVDILKTAASRASDDQALFSTLKSPIVNLSDGEILSIKNAFFNEKFSTAVLRYSKEKSDSLAARLREFYSYLERIVLISGFEGCATLLRRIVDEKHIDLSILSSPRGDVKYKRVERFLNGLKKPGGEYTLTEFIGRQKSILENVKAAEPAGEDSIRIMTMHKSKGLEAPVVIVIGMNSNIKAANKDAICKNREFGLGVKYYDRSKKTRESTVVFNYISKKNDLQSLEEESRLLYVAMTRAKIRLHIVCERRDPDKLKQVTDATKLIDLIYPEDMECVDRTEEELETIGAEGLRSPALPAPDERMTEKISSELLKTYPFEDDVTLPLKKTVTEIAKSARYEDEPFAVSMFDSSDVEHGLAYHRFLEVCSLSCKNVAEEKEKLLKEGKLTAEEAGYLENEKLENVLSSPVFKEAEGYELFREQPFIVNAPAELVKEKGDGYVLLQGVIDLLAVKDDKAIVIDYKFSFADADALKRRYEKQLELYAFAAKKILGIENIRKIIFNINLGCFIEV